jgi:hypothetical protein
LGRHSDPVRDSDARQGSLRAVTAVTEGPGEFGIVSGRPEWACDPVT